MNDIESKFILDLSRFEIIEEIREVLRMPKLKPVKETLGHITADPGEYMNGGEVDPEKLKDVYNRDDKLIMEYISTIAVTSVYNRGEGLYKLIRQAKLGDVVLDYGCGSGSHGIGAAQLGAEVHIMDISKPILNVAIARFDRRNLNYVAHRSAKTIPFNRFNYIYCTDVIEHVPRPDIMLMDFIKYLKVGGIAHLKITPCVCGNRGHLEQAINIWKTDGKRILKQHFEDLGKHNYKLVRK